MPATLEPIITVCGRAQVWIARSGPEHARYGDPYAIACVVVRSSDATAHVAALTAGDNSAQLLLGLREPLRNAGFTQVEWERRKNSGRRMVRMPLRKI